MTLLDQQTVDELGGYFLTVSSLNYRKNFISVLDAFSLFSEMSDKGALFIIGDLSNGSFQGIDIEEYKMNPRIKFLGRVSDDELVWYYRNAMCFVFPSLYEGFGIPVLEAQACGCPVISTDSSSLPEVLGDSALMCNPLDVKKMSELMQRVYNDVELRKMLVAKGNMNVKRFSWDKSAEKVAKIISKL